MTPPSFTPKSLSFLRSLKRNNDREWFRARKEDYERHVRAPMVAVIERLAVDFGRFAPELDASPKRCIYRIYRDTRFSGDKTPLKTHIAASFRWRGLPRGRSAGLYFEVHPQWVWMGGGFYAPEPADLVRIRQHISDTHPELHQLTRARLIQARISRARRRTTDASAAWIPERRPRGGISQAPELPRRPRIPAGVRDDARRSTRRCSRPSRPRRRLCGF